MRPLETLFNASEVTLDPFRPSNQLLRRANSCIQREGSWTEQGGGHLHVHCTLFSQPYRQTRAPYHGRFPGRWNFKSRRHLDSDLPGDLGAWSKLVVLRWSPSHSSGAPDKSDSELNEIETASLENRINKICVGR